jgi:arsenate reductase (glutaredoxin)
MKKVFFLKTCSTCIKIMNQLDLVDFEQVNVKSQSITQQDLDQMVERGVSYSGLMNKSAQKYKALGLKDQVLTEEDCRTWLLKEYTFLKRPVFIIDNGQKSTVEQLVQKIGKNK